MRPVILITTKPMTDPSNFSVGGLRYTPANYCRAVQQAGGLPVLAVQADAEEYAALADGIVFTGSNCDITPSFYGMDQGKAANCDPELDRWEIGLFQAFSRRRKPILGICRGIQLINVALGGTLIRDIPDEVPDLTVHDRVYQKLTVSHPVTAQEGSLLQTLFGSSFTTNSYHHQALKNCGAGLIPTVTTEEGVIEGVEHESLPILGVQWHPERMIGQEQTELTDMLPLLRHFVDLCKNSRQ